MHSCPSVENILYKTKPSGVSETALCDHTITLFCIRPLESMLEVGDNLHREVGEILTPSHLQYSAYTGHGSRLHQSTFYRLSRLLHVCGMTCMHQKFLDAVPQTCCQSGPERPFFLHCSKELLGYLLSSRRVWRDYRV